MSKTGWGISNEFTRLGQPPGDMYKAVQEVVTSCGGGVVYIGQCIGIIMCLLGIMISAIYLVIHSNDSKSLANEKAMLPGKTMAVVGVACTVTLVLLVLSIVSGL